MTEYKAIGVMSGTSLDGMDIALCHFYLKDNLWEFKIREAITIKYPTHVKDSLINASTLSALELIRLHKEYGMFIGNSIIKFNEITNSKPDFIASHGHTIFHQPKNGITFQLGNGNNIAASSGITTISDFRTMDVALGGQGAPLVPIGDKLLFGEFDYCINLGGFANISSEENNERIAFDICPVNIGINYLTSLIGIEYDKDGNLARKGSINSNLLNRLNKINYYKSPPPKSLGKEWLDEHILPLLENNETLENKLRSLYEHIIQQIKKVILNEPSNKVLITGGGAHNKFLIELLKVKTKVEIIIPNKKIIDYKEALIFAFLGVLKIRNEINCLSSVTGANRDSSCGTIHSIK